MPLWGSSEAREAHVVWEVAHTENKILPTRAGIIPSKPPMFHWIGGAFYSLFDWIQPLSVARFVSLIGSIIFLLFSFRLVSLFGDTSGISIVIIMTSWLFLAQSTDAKVDMLFAGFLVGSLYFGSSLILQKLFNYKQWIASVVLLVLAVLCKGPLAIGLIGLLLGGMIIFSRDIIKNKLTILWLSSLILSLLIVAVVSSVWYLTAANLGGEAFISRQLLFENLHRIIGHHKMNTQPWWFYAPSLMRTIFPWSFVALLIVFKSSLRNQFSERSRLSLILFAIGIIALSLASGKRHSYPLPLLPFLAAGIAPAVSQLVCEKKLIRLTSIILPIFITISCVGLTVKGVKKNYQGLSDNIINASSGKKITILKDEFDESLDTIMYFLRAHLSVVNKISANEESNMCLISDSDSHFDLIEKTIPDKIVLKDQNYILTPCAVINALPRNLPESFK